MKHLLKYDEYPSFELPDNINPDIYDLIEVAVPDPKVCILNALSNPIELNSLENTISKKSRILFICDDMTRQTRADIILPIIIDKVKKLGVKDDNISIMIAYGTHRVMSFEEKEVKLGREIVNKYECIDHIYYDSAMLEYIGDTPSGIPIDINKRIHEFDDIIAIGQISPHPLAGYSGGCKMIMPGVCGKRTADKIHWLGAKTTNEIGNLVGLTASFEEKGDDPNPVRREIESVGIKAGLTAILNTINNSNGEIIDAVFGHPIFAFRKGAVIAKELLTVSATKKYDIVIADSHPTDIDFWQANKALRNAESIVKDGGLLILITPCPEGFTPEHPLIEEYGYMSYEKADTLIKAGKITDYIGAGNSTTVGKILSRISCAIVSNGIKKSIAMRVGLLHFTMINKAIEYSLNLKDNPEVAIIKNGGDTLPIFKKL